MAKYGVDISKWNGAIDFAKLAAKLGDGGFAFIRASYGDVNDAGVRYAAQDAKFAAYWPAAKAAGLRRGVYTYYHQSVSAGDQLMTLLKAVNTDWGELPPAVDVEQPVKDASGNPVVWTLTQNKDLQWFIWALGKICGKTPIIYTGVGYWSAYVLPSYSGNPTATSKDNSWAKTYQLWIANWSVAAGGAPPLPQPWSTYAYHQYGKGTGSDYGAESAEIDLDIEYNENPTPPPTYPTPVFKASATSITAGQSVTLSWSNTDGANEIRLNGAAQSGPAGSAVVKPTVNTTYSLFVGYPDAPSVTLKVAILVTPAPVPTAKPKLGYNFLYEAWAGGAAYNQGCRFFLGMNNTDGVNQLAAIEDNSLMLIYRQWWDHAPGVAEAVTALHPSRINPRVIRTISNECYGFDNILSQSYMEIEVTKRLKAINPNIIVAVGTFAMGNPDFNKQQVCDDMRKAYADAYNSGLVWFDMHLYSPTINHIYDDNELKWYERRWEFLFTKCGFDASVRHLISGECGEDEGGAGGFLAHKRTPAEVAAYCKRWVEIQSRPIVVNGVSYPSPLIGGALYQLGDTSTDNGHWGGYAMDSYLATISAAGVY